MPFSSFVAVLWMDSSTLTPFLNFGGKNCATAGYAVFDACQDVVCPLGCQGALLTCIEPAASHHPQIPFCRSALQPLLFQCLLVPGITQYEVQNMALGLVKSLPNAPI